MTDAMDGPMQGLKVDGQRVSYQLCEFIIRVYSCANNLAYNFQVGLCMYWSHLRNL